MMKNKNSQHNGMQGDSPQVKKSLKKLNRYFLIFILIISASGTAIYVNNVMRVNKLLNEIRGLEKKRDSVITVNQHLKTKVLDMQSASRITHIAKEKLGMIPNPKAPASVHR